jgi:DNA-binding NarL/FixJ family response regulator
MRQSARTPHRVVLAGSHAAVRVGMRLALERDGFDVVAEVTTARDAVVAGAATRPDACVVDLALPEALASVREIHRREPRTALVVLSERPEEHELVAALRAGASCYLPTEIAADDFAAALRGVLVGQARIPRHLLPSLVADAQDRVRHRHRRVESRLRIRLTAREWTVMELLREGASTDQVAARLEISAVTVRRHISEVMGKLQAADRTTALDLLSRADG